MMKILPRHYLLTVLASLFLPRAQSAPLPTTAELQSAAQASFKEWVEVLPCPTILSSPPIASAMSTGLSKRSSAAV
jgi:hypothetical protein